MSTLNNSSFISTFLSHASVDKPLVEAVAKELGRRGVLTWFDKNELLEMGPLDIALKRAVQQQTTLTIFLSEASLKSSWCRDELKWAIEAQEGDNHLLPIYLGDPLALVKEHDLLRSHFLHADGDKVNQLGHVCNLAAPDPKLIADKIAATAYRRSIPSNWSEVIIYLDQRGQGIRRGSPELPENIARLQAPTFTFRPDLGSREQRDLLLGETWQDVTETMARALSTALSTTRGKTRDVRVMGNAQTSLMWAIGTQFDRTTSADLYAYGRDELSITNRGQARYTPLSGGNPDAAQPITEGLLNAKTSHAKVALGVGSKEQYASVVQAAIPELPLLWIESGVIRNSNDAMALVADLVASVDSLRQQYQVSELVLFWTTANHVAVLGAANLTSHVIPKIRFMEWNHAASEYVYQPMPGGN